MRKTIEGLLKISCLAAVLGLASSSCGGDHAGDMLTAPAEVKAMVLAGPAVHLTWKDTASEHHYSIQRKGSTGDFMEIGTEEINKTAYHDAAVMTGTYSYRVAAAKHDGTLGPFSEVVTATVP
jgi:hypothetical protein